LICYLRQKSGSSFAAQRRRSPEAPPAAQVENLTWLHENVPQRCPHSGLDLDEYIVHEPDHEAESQRLQQG
jgi:hypothetical protein